MVHHCDLSRPFMGLSRQSSTTTRQSYEAQKRPLMSTLCQQLPFIAPLNYCSLTSSFRWLYSRSKVMKQKINFGQHTDKHMSIQVLMCNESMYQGTIEDTMTTVATQCVVIIIIISIQLRSEVTIIAGASSVSKS